MKRLYITPEIQLVKFALEVPISASIGEDPDAYERYPDGTIPGGGGTGDGGVGEGDSRRRNNYSSRDDMVGGWRRGGLW